MQRAFGWRDISYRRANIGQNRRPTTEHPAETLAAVRRFNQLDIALYDEARRLLAEQAAESGPTLRFRKMVLTIRNRVSGRTPGS